MDSPILTLIGIGVTVVIALCGWLLKQNRDQSIQVTAGLQKNADAVNAQAVSIARVEGVVTSVVGRVDDLSRWKEEQQRRELEEARDRIADMKQALRAKEA